MIATWPQAALRGSSSVASAGPPSCICLIGNTRVRSVARLSSPQRTEAARMKEASTELQPSTLPEAWERSSLSDDGIREALRARSKHYAALDEVDQADSATMSPERSALGVSPSICTKHPVWYLQRHRDRPILFSSTLTRRRWAPCRLQKGPARQPKSLHTLPLYECAFITCAENRSRTTHRSARNR